MFNLLTLPVTDQECQTLILTELYPEGIVCPWQQHRSVLIRPTYLWCPCCRKKWSLKKQLGFGFSKLGWRQILGLVMTWMGKQSPGDIHVSTGLSYPTILRWLERLRQRLSEARTPLAGRLEIDQSYLGRKKCGTSTSLWELLSESERRFD